VTRLCKPILLLPAWIATLILVLTSPQVASWRRDRALSVNTHRLDESKDPPLGSALPREIADTVRLRRGRWLLVIALGSCSSCSLQSFEENTVGDLKQTTVVLLFSSQASQITYKPRLSNVQTMADPRSILTERILNAALVPRVYLYSSAGELVDLQRDTQSYEIFIQQAARVHGL
jgi:hypothetical protein